MSFDATCEVRPEITVPGYGGLRVELSSPTATEAEIDQAVEAELRRQGTLIDVDRAVQSGDHVTINLAGTRDGEPVAGLNTEDWLYEVGNGWVAAGFDGELIGAEAGDELTFTATPNGTNEPADFVVERLQGARDGASRAHRRVGRRQPRRVRHGGGMARLVGRTYRCRQAQPDAQPVHRAHDVGAGRTGRHRTTRVDGASRFAGPRAEHRPAIAVAGNLGRAVAAGHRSRCRRVHRELEGRSRRRRSRSTSACAPSASPRASR